MSNHNEFEQAQNLLLETASLMAKFRHDTDKIVDIVDDVQSKLNDALNKSLIEQRNLIIGLVKEEITQETGMAIKRYVTDIDNIQNNLSRQVYEFNQYLSIINKRNRQLSSRWLMISSITLASLVIGAITLVFFFSQVISQKKVEADMVFLINQSDIVKCGNDLCANVSKKATVNGYHIILKRK